MAGASPAGTMSQRNRTRTIDREILSSSDAILDDIVERLGISLYVAPSGAGEHGEREVDAEVAGLRGSVFDGLPTREIPLEAFHIDEPAPASRPRIDSFAPITMGGASSPPPAISPSSTPPEPERSRAWRRATWVLGHALAAGLAGFVAVGAITRTRQETKPTVAAAHVLVQDPAPAVDPASVPASGPVPITRPTPVPAAAPRSASRPAVVAARAVAPAPATPTAADEADEAELPLVLPPPPPKPVVDLDRAAAAVAIAGTARAASCREAGAGPIAVPVRVTFASSGSTTSAGVTGGPLVGTPEGACMARALRGARVPAFDGEPAIVTTVVHLR
jgi:hypothetical protein